MRRSALGSGGLIARVWWAAWLAVLMVVAGCGGGSDDRSAPAGEPSMRALAVTPVAGITVVELVRVAEVRVGRTLFEYTFKVTFKGGDSSQRGVSARVQSLVPAIEVVDGDVLIGDIAAAQRLTPGDTVAIRIDRARTGYSPSHLSWAFTTGSDTETVASVSLSPGALMFTKVGETLALTATMRAADGTPITGRPVTFTSSAPGVVAVSAQGVITAVQALGSAQVRATVDGVESKPVSVLVATPATGSVLVRDDQIVRGPIALSPLDVFGAGSQVQVTVSGLAVPAVGAIVMSSGEKPVAGKVVEALPVAGGNTTLLTLEIVPLAALFRSLSADFSAPSSVAASATVPAAASRLQAGTSALADADPECKPSVTPNAITIKQEVKVDPSLSIAQRVVIADSKLQAYEFVAEGKIDVSHKVSLAAAGTVTLAYKCSWVVPTRELPLPGALAALKAGLPISLQFEAAISGALTVLFVGRESTYSIPTKVGVSLSPEGVSGLRPIADLNFANAQEKSESKFTAFASFPFSQAPRVTINARVGPGLGLSLGANVPGAPMYELARASLLLEHEWKYAGLANAATDSTFDSAHKVKASLSLKPGGAVKKALDLLEKNIPVSPELALKLEKTIARSPSALSVLSGTRAFRSGQTIEATIRLDPPTRYIGPLSTVYNVNEIRIYRLFRNPTLGAGPPREPQLVASVPALEHQADFDLAWVADHDGMMGDPETGNYFAFVVPKILPVIGSIYPFPLKAVTSTETWDLALDFSPAANPNGRWAYGYCWRQGDRCNNRIGEFLYKYALNYSGVDIRIWDSDRYAGVVSHNPTSATISSVLGLPWEPPGQAQTSVTYLPGKFYIHPGLQDNVGYVNWLSPGGRFHVKATFTPVDTRATGVEAMILRTEGTGTGYEARHRVVRRIDTPANTSTDYEDELEVPAGASLGFGVGNAGDFLSDTTRMDVKITRLGEAAK